MSVKKAIEELKITGSGTCWLVGYNLELFVKYDGKQYELNVDYPVKYEKTYKDAESLLNAITRREFKTSE